MSSRGSMGRIPDSKIAEHEMFERLNITLQPDLNRRLCKFCEDEERAKSWVIQKALDKYLTKEGY